MSTIDALKSRKIPIEAVLTRKAGSKFLMNLFYYLDKQKYYSDPYEVESSSDLRWTTVEPVADETELIRITLFRDPYLRFSAFYFESIYLQSATSWMQWRSQLDQKGFDFDAAQNLSAHQKNVDILLSLLADKIKRNGLYHLPGQVEPQVKSILPAQDVGFEVINHSLVNVELVNILRPYIKHIEGVVSRILKSLEAPDPVEKQKLLTEEQKAQLREIYAIDFDFFEAMRYGTT